MFDLRKKVLGKYNHTIVYPVYFMKISLIQIYDCNTIVVMICDCSVCYDTANNLSFIFQVKYD